MEIKDIKAVYFVGAGGIGMSAIARISSRKVLWWLAMTRRQVPLPSS